VVAEGRLGTVISEIDAIDGLPASKMLMQLQTLSSAVLACRRPVRSALQLFRAVFGGDRTERP
jgi:hypothetical protein